MNKTRKTSRQITVGLTRADIPRSLRAATPERRDLELRATGVLSVMIDALISRAESGAAKFVPVLTTAEIRDLTGLDTVSVLAALDYLREERGSIEALPASLSWRLVRYLDADNPTTTGLDALRDRERQKKQRQRARKSGAVLEPVAAPQRMPTKEPEKDRGVSVDWEAAVTSVRALLGQADAVERIAADAALILAAYASAYRRSGKICTMIEGAAPNTQRKHRANVKALEDDVRLSIARFLCEHHGRPFRALPRAFGERGLLAGVIPADTKVEEPQRSGLCVSPVGHVERPAEAPAAPMPAEDPNARLIEAICRGWEKLATEVSGSPQSATAADREATARGIGKLGPEAARAYAEGAWKSQILDAWKRGGKTFGVLRPKELWRDGAVERARATWAWAEKDRLAERAKQRAEAAKAEEESRLAKEAEERHVAELGRRAAALTGLTLGHNELGKSWDVLSLLTGTADEDVVAGLLTEAVAACLEDQRRRRADDPDWLPDYIEYGWYRERTARGKGEPASPSEASEPEVTAPVEWDRLRITAATILDPVVEVHYDGTLVDRGGTAPNDLLDEIDDALARLALEEARAAHDSVHLEIHHGNDVRQGWVNGTDARAWNGIHHALRNITEAAAEDQNRFAAQA